MFFGKAQTKHISINGNDPQEPLLVYCSESESEQKDVKSEKKKSEDINEAEKSLIKTAFNLLAGIKDVYRPCAQARMFPQSYLKNVLAILPGLHEKFKKAFEYFLSLKIEKTSDSIFNVLYNLRAEAIFLKTKIETTYIANDKNNEIKQSTQVLAAHVVLSIDSFAPKSTLFQPRGPSR